MKSPVFILTAVINFIMLIILSATTYFISTLFNLGVPIDGCLFIGGSVILFIIYPCAFSAVRRTIKKQNG